MPINFADPDECCGPALSAALLSGVLELVDEWMHEECGCQWKANTIGTVRHWTPQPMIEVFN